MKPILVYEMVKVPSFVNRIRWRIIEQNGEISSEASDEHSHILCSSIYWKDKPIHIGSIGIPSLSDFRGIGYVFLRGADKTEWDREQEFDWGNDTYVMVSLIQAALREFANYGGFNESTTNLRVCSDGGYLYEHIPVSCREMLKPPEWGIITLYQGLEYQI